MSKRKEQLEVILNRLTDVIRYPDEAWEEIERLRAENERLQKTLTKWIKTNNAAAVLINEQQADIKWLRHNLGLIRDVCKSYDPLAAQVTAKVLAESALANRDQHQDPSAAGGNL